MLRTPRMLAVMGIIAICILVLAQDAHAQKHTTIASGTAWPIKKKKADRKLLSTDFTDGSTGYRRPLMFRRKGGKPVIVLPTNP